MSIKKFLHIQKKFAPVNIHTSLMWSSCLSANSSWYVLTTLISAVTLLLGKRGNTQYMCFDVEWKGHGAFTSCGTLNVIGTIIS